MSSDDRKPRVTGARQLDCLRHELASLLTEWDRSTNPILLSAAGQLRLAMGQAQSMAYVHQRGWEQRQYERSLREDA